MALTAGRGSRSPRARTSAEARETGWIEASPYSDFIVKRKVGGLMRGTRYHYRLRYGPDKDRTRLSAAATFRTLAGSGIAAPYSFVVVTGMNYSFFHYTGSSRVGPYEGPDKDLGYPALASILKLEPDFFVGTGDNVYYDHPGHRGRAQTRHEMRKKHHEQYSQPRFLDLFRNVATYWMKDDHDHRFDDSDAVNAVRDPRPETARLLPAHQHPRGGIGIGVSSVARAGPGRVPGADAGRGSGGPGRGDLQNLQGEPRPAGLARRGTRLPQSPGPAGRAAQDHLGSRAEGLAAHDAQGE